MSALFLQCVPFMFLVATWITTFFTVQTFKISKRSLILSIGYTAIIWTSFVVGVTEILSFFSAITRTNLFILWSLILVVEVIWCFLKRKNNDFFRDLCDVYAIFKGKRFHIIDTILVIVLAFLLLRSTFVALYTAPASWDGMTYHLPRIMYWIEHRSVNYYFTNIERQLFSPVIGEYINLQVMCLTGGDYFIKMLQNFSSYGSVFIIMSMIYRMTKSYRASISGAILLAASNIYFAQSVSVQVDLSSGLFLLIVTNMLYEVIASDNTDLRNDFSFFLILGLGCGVMFGLKSSTAIPAAFMIFCVFIYRLIKKDCLWHLLLMAFGAGICALVINLPQFMRNLYEYGDILAMSEMGRISTGTAKPNYVIANVVKNMGSIFSSWWNNDLIIRAVNKAARILNVNLNAPEICFDGQTYYVYYLYDVENASASLLIGFLFLASVLGLFRVIIKHKKDDIMNFVLLIQFFLMAAVLRWQPWCARLLLPSMMVSVVPISCIIDNTLKDIKPGLLQKYISFVIVSYISVACILGNNESFRYFKGLMGLEEEERLQTVFSALFSNEEAYYVTIMGILDEKDFNSLGIYSDYNSYQYPMLARYKKRANIENVILFESETERIQREYVTGFVPEYVMVTEEWLDDSQKYYWNGHAYNCIYMDRDFSLWEINR